MTAWEILAGVLWLLAVVITGGPLVLLAWCIWQGVRNERPDDRG